MLKVEKVLGEKTKDELIEICKSFKSKSLLFSEMKISDNSKSVAKFNQILSNKGIELESLWQKDKKICLNCGKELKRNQKKFCSKSCASTYNNSRREKSLRPSFKKIEKNSFF